MFVDGLSGNKTSGERWRYRFQARPVSSPRSSKAVQHSCTRLHNIHLLYHEYDCAKLPYDGMQARSQPSRSSQWPVNWNCLLRTRLNDCIRACVLSFGRPSPPAECSSFSWSTSLRAYGGLSYRRWQYGLLSRRLLPVLPPRSCQDLTQMLRTTSIAKRAPPPKTD